MNMKRELVSSVMIETYCESEMDGSGKVFSKLRSVRRVVSVNGERVYEDRMSPMMHAASRDPIRVLENFLLGLEKSDGGKDVCGDDLYSELKGEEDQERETYRDHLRTFVSSL